MEGRKAHCTWKGERLCIIGREKGSLYLEGRSLNVPERRRLNAIGREKGSLYLEEIRLNVPGRGKMLFVTGREKGSPYLEG